MARGIAIRPMRAVDAPAISRMIRALAAFHGDDIKISPRDLVSRCLGRNKMAVVLMATVDKHPVGFVLTYDWMNFLRKTPVRHIDFIFVSEKYRQSGVGAALTIAVVKNAVGDGCGRVTVGATKDNKMANDFYNKLGFEKRSDHSVRYILTGNSLKRLATNP